MNPIIERELCIIEPTVPFHATTSHHHRTWAETFHSYPELYVQPQSLTEIHKVVTLARRCRRRIAIAGCAHSPSDLTLTSSWLVNLDNYSKILDVNVETKIVVMQSGIRLHNLGLRLKEYGLAMPNLGSIDHQSIAGAIGTATHGSSIQHGILSQSVLGLSIMLADGRILSCSAEENTELFRAALVSLGALGIITQVTFQAVSAFNVKWRQSLHPLEQILVEWEKDLWTQAEFTRVWWMPYMKRCIRWRAEKTKSPLQPPVVSQWRGVYGYHIYQFLLYIAHWLPGFLPGIERLAIWAQYGLTEGAGSVAVEESRTGLLMNCLYSQFVNEWAIPLHRGPEAITRLSAWLHGDEETARIPFSSCGVYIHAPIEVRVSDTSGITPRPYLDNTVPDGPTLYLNATLYRPYGYDPPCRERYYEAFEWLMKEMEGRPHWAKNFITVSRNDIYDMYPELDEWRRVRDEVDPEGMFVGDWHRRLLFAENIDMSLPLEERLESAKPAKQGGIEWKGQIPTRAITPTSEESFEVL